MKKILLFVLMALVGISLTTTCFADNRTIAWKSGYANAENTVITASGGTLRLVTGFAGSGNSNYSIHNTATISGAGNTNLLCEGGEATQYDSLGVLDFGNEGIEFSTGLTVITSTAKVSVLYQ